MIQSLAQTPLPTILVVAGIIFLFLSVGGRLGAQIATDTIKRNFAGVLGVILLIGGISLYFAGQPHYQPQTPHEEKPPKDVGLNNYKLRANSLPSGRTIEKRSQFSMSDGTVTFQDGVGHVVTGKINIEGGDSEKLEILSSSNGRPTAFKQTILSDVTKTTIHIAENVTTNTEHGVLNGHSILIEKKDGVWVKSLLGSEPTEAQRNELREPYEDDYETYPAGSVKIGAEWRLDGPQIAYMSGFQNLLSVDGSASMTFEKLVDHGGEKCAVILVKRLELDGIMLNNTGNVVRFKLGGSGAIYRSLTKFIDTKWSFEGTMMADGEIILEEQKVKMNIVGPINVTGNDNLLTE